MRDELGLNSKTTAVDGLVVSIRFQKQAKARKMHTKSNIWFVLALFISLTLLSSLSMPAALAEEHLPSRRKCEAPPEPMHRQYRHQTHTTSYYWKHPHDMNVHWLRAILQ